MKTRLVVRIMLLVILALAAPGCNYAPVEDRAREAAYTAGAATLIARLTQEASTAPTAQVTSPAKATGQSGPPPKQTAEPPTATPSETPLPPSPTIIQPTSTPENTATWTPPPAPCNQAELLGDVNAPPDSVFPGGTLLTKVWRVRNIGSCTWGTGYSLILLNGNLISAAATALPTVVAPGQIVDVAVTVTVPGYSGAFQATWMLRSDAGQVFGAGADGSVPLFARIQVPQPTAGPATSYDFTQNYCSLSWRSAEGALGCPGSPQDPDGSIVLVQSSVIESGRTNLTGLWTRPNRSTSGWISGQTPALLIRSGDHFVAEIGCMSDSPECDVLFQFEYAALDGSNGRLGQWRETNDGRTASIDIDLSSLAGRSVAFTLTVFNRGRARDANAVWLQPRIQPGAVPRDNALVWKREGSPFANSCQELHIAHTGTNSAIAIAYDCIRTPFEIGRALLTTSQLNQLLNWEDRLDDFEGEMYSAGGNHPVTTWIYFRGFGNRVAGQPEIQALSTFAAQIYNQITRPR